nr:CAP domain-containing protein [Streptomyces sp. 846.5]
MTTATGGATTAMTAAEDQVLALVNVQRVANGCAALSYSGPLTVLAQNFSAEMATLKFFDHTDPHGKTPWDRANGLGISNLGGENIAMGQQTPEDVMAAWMKSPGHRANILDCAYHSLGVGVYYASSGGPWWTQDFGF